MKLTLTALTVAANLFAGSAYAFDPDDLQQLKYTNECKSCDLSGANLHSTDLSGASLFDAELSGAYLSGADLKGAIMNGAILCNTTMPDGSVIYSGC